MSKAAAEIVQFDEAKLKVKPKNIGELGQKCDALFFEVKRNAAQALRWSYEIGRDIAEFAQRDEIVEAVKRINFPNGPKGPKKEGRPKTATGYVVELLTTGPEGTSNVGDKWLLRCTRAYEFCAAKKLDFNKGINAVLGYGGGLDTERYPNLQNALPNPERLLPTEPTKTGKSKKEKPLKREIAKICKALEKFFADGSGHPRVRKLEDVSQLLRAMDKILRVRANARVDVQQKG